MTARLRVWALSESFANVWTGLAESAGLEALVEERLEDLPRADRSDQTILSLAGREEEAVAALGSLHATGVQDSIVVGSAADHRLASAVLTAGALDYYALPDDLEALRNRLVERAERNAAEARARGLTDEARARYDFSRMVGESPALRATLDRAARVIPHAAATVLITGETGTGKEVLARAIHFNGPRAEGPFVEINCSAVPATLLEAELFGYEAGAFTDARAPKPGLFESANGGSLFLDEIGDLSLELQAKLLKVLEEKEVRRLGSVRTQRLDLRIIAATHNDLAAAVARGRFRQDLFFRLNVVPLHLPALRDRGTDVVALAEHFLGEIASAYGLQNPGLPPDIRKSILEHPWPGNVRELRNAIERAVLLGGGHIVADDLFPGGPAVSPSSGTIPFPATLDAIESAAARAMVERFGGNKSAAAAALGVSRSRLYRLLGADV